MIPHADRPPVYVDANPLADKHLTGIGRYTARIALAMAADGPVRFFTGDREIVPPPDLRWHQDQDLARWGRRVWRGERRPLGTPPTGSMAVYGCLRPAERRFPFEVSILHDFTTLVVPHTHAESTRGLFRGFFAETLLSSDAALAVSDHTKFDASWLCDFPQERIGVCHSGPSLCIERHLHVRPVRRRPNVGLVVSTIEPRKNAPFLLEWFRNSTVLPRDTELWWVGPVGWLTDRRSLRRYERLDGRRVRFLGVVSDAKLCELYQTAGWSVYPSLYEGFGFPVLDSLRHGAPVFASDNSALREFTVPGVDFFDPGDASTLDAAWSRRVEIGPPAIDLAGLDDRYRWGRVASAIRGLAQGRDGAGVRAA